MDETPQPTTDTVIELLSNQRRRHVLSYLRERSRPVPLADLATRLARREHDAGREGVEERSERIYCRLHHVHVPKLAEAGLVERRPDRDAVELGPAGDVLDEYSPFLPDVAASSDVPRSE